MAPLAAFTVCFGLLDFRHHWVLGTRSLSNVNALGFSWLRASVFSGGALLFFLFGVFAGFAIATLVLLAECLGLEFVPVAIDGGESGLVSI